jgi:hypothetical protein
MVDVNTFFKVDLSSWVEGTISKVQSGEEWNSAWQQTYFELGGTSKETARKPCPMVAARTLYELGRVSSYGEIQEVALIKVLENHSKNGAYAIAAIDCLNHDSTLTLMSLWSQVQERVRAELGVEPAISNQGGTTLTYKLWHLGMLR